MEVGLLRAAADMRASASATRAAQARSLGLTTDALRARLEALALGHAARANSGAAAAAHGGEGQGGDARGSGIVLGIGGVNAGNVSEEDNGLRGESVGDPLHDDVAREDSRCGQVDDVAVDYRNKARCQAPAHGGNEIRLVRGRKGRD